MGIQSTIDITREEAEKKYVEIRKEKIDRQLSAEAVLLEDDELEDYIEEEFYNYSIIG